MDIVALTRQLVDIESITGNEATVGHFLEQELRKLGYESRRMPVEGERANVYATSSQQPTPTIVFSTHMDTVPPFIASSEDDEKIHGRGSCDAKGIIATQIAAAESLKEQGILDDNRLAEIEKDVHEQVEHSVRFADESPEPDPKELYTNVYANQ